MAEKGENLNVTRSQRNYQGKRNGAQSEKQNGENIQTQVQEIPVVQNNETKKVEEPTHEVVDCLTCCEPINYFSISKCGHTSICSMCVIRMRVLFDELECPLCKVQLDDVIFTANPNVVYSDISANKNKMIYDRRCKAYFEDSKFEREIQKLWELKCSKCSSVHNTMNGLSAHIKASHNLSYCQICLEHQKVFFCEKVLYTPEELNAHNKNGDTIRKIKPHPSCDFCHKVFFSEDDLYYHCRDNHFTCFICDRQNMKHHYFKDYQHLEKHFKSKHFFCADPHCVASRFVAFSSSFELQAHNVSVHFQTMTREQQQAARTVEVNFTIRRGDSDRNRPSTLTAPPTRNTSSHPTSNGGYNREDGSICFNPDDFMDNKPLSPSTSTNNVTTNKTNNNNNNNSNNNQIRLNGSGNISNEERTERNVALKNKILIFFDGDQKLLTEIMKKTKFYLDGLIGAAEFHTEIVHTFGESENSRQIYDELVTLFPKKNKKERDEILNYRQKLSQTQNIFPSLSETATVPVVVPITPVVAPQGTNYKNSVGASNSKQIVDSAFPGLPVSAKKEPASEPIRPANLPTSANSYQPGSGRGFPIHSQPKPKPTPEQQSQQAKQQQQQQQQKQTKPKPSYDASTAPIPTPQPKKQEQLSQNKPTPKPSYDASTAPIPKQAKPKDQQQNQQNKNAPKQTEQQNKAAPKQTEPQQQNKAVPKQTEPQQQQNQNKTVPKQQTESQQNQLAKTVPKQQEQQNKTVPKQQEVPDIPPHLQQQQPKQDSQAKNLYIPPHLQQQNQQNNKPKQEEVPDIPPHLQQPKQQESQNKSATSVPIGNSSQPSGGAGRGKKKQQKQVMMSWG
jgi:hypothetical protein